MKITDDKTKSDAPPLVTIYTVINNTINQHYYLLEIAHPPKAVAFLHPEQLPPRLSLYEYSAEDPELHLIPPPTPNNGEMQ